MNTKEEILKALYDVMVAEYKNQTPEPAVGEDTPFLNMEEFKAQTGCTTTKSNITMSTKDGKVVFAIGNTNFWVGEGWRTKEIDFVKNALDAAYILGFTDCGSELMPKIMQDTSHINKLELCKEIVCSRYPDACERVYASRSMVIWCPMLDCRLSGFFLTFEEAWLDAVKWIEKKEVKKRYKSSTLCTLL